MLCHMYGKTSKISGKYTGIFYVSRREQDREEKWEGKRASSFVVNLRIKEEIEKLCCGTLT